MSSRSVSSGRPHGTVYVACVYARYDGVMPMESEKVESVENFLKTASLPLYLRGKPLSRAIRAERLYGPEACLSLSLSPSLARAAVMLEMKSQ